MRTAMLVVSMAVVGLPAAAERNLVPSLGSEPAVCIDQPPEPDWMQGIGARDAFKRVLVQDIYRAQNLERVVATRSCPCEARFPSWEEAETEFRKHFADAERWEMLKASDIYNQRASTLRPEAKVICEAEWNW